ncbi:MAG: hypothetical protein AB8B53_10555 [Flavobacteriales bacterium]
MTNRQNKFNSLSHSNEVDSQLKDIIGGYNLEQLEVLKQTLDSHFKQNYTS